MPATLLKPGQNAPEINAHDQDGNIVKIGMYKGSKLIVFFYPKDNTSGCTKEVCNLRDNFSLLTKKGIKILGVSIDNEESHRKFIENFDLPFPLIADPEQKVVKAWKVWGEKTLYGREYMGTHRVTYLVDEAGKIAHVIEKVETDNHAEQILALLKSDK